MLKEIDLANKCGSCDHFRQIDGTAQGECLKNPYGERVVHNPKYPYWIVLRSRAKCRWYNAPPPTNEDRIRAEIATVEGLAEYLIQYMDDWGDYCTPAGCYDTLEEAKEATVKWLKQPAEGE